MNNFPEIDKHFIVPEGYFDELVGNVMQKIDRDDVGRLKSRVVVFRRIAVAASVVAVVAVGTLLYNITASQYGNVTQINNQDSTEYKASVITIPQMNIAVDNTTQSIPKEDGCYGIGQKGSGSHDFVAVVDNSDAGNIAEQADLFTDEDAVDFIYVNTQSIQMIVDPEEL